MLKRSLSAFFILCCALPLLAYVPAVDSVYTNITGARCKTVETHEEGASSVQKCAGVAGYSLLVEDDDSRQSVIAPTYQSRPLRRATRT